MFEQIIDEQYLYDTNFKTFDEINESVIIMSPKYLFGLELISKE